MKWNAAVTDIYIYIYISYFRLFICSAFILTLPQVICRVVVNIFRDLLKNMITLLTYFSFNATEGSGKHLYSHLEFSAIKFEYNLKYNTSTK